MSVKHATVSAWQRDHDGAYTAEINGFNLKVTWVPEGTEAGHGFRWEAVSPDGKRAESQELQEEIEFAMAEAEAATEPSDEPGEEEAA
ncbi:MAG: hypothetical protein IPK82_26795 [Polyangiaceae bacterium]|nr:hypothetical protein [Polyangiaceae bacterium]